MRNTKLKKIRPEIAMLFKPCPKHGREHLVKEGASVFCFAKTKMDIIDRCFYHVSKVKEKVKSKKLKVTGQSQGKSKKLKVKRQKAKGKKL